MVHDPETCLCSQCILDRDIASGKEPLFPHHNFCNCVACISARVEEYTMKAKKSEVSVSVVRGRLGSIPDYLPLFQRHFEKAMPVVASNKQASLNAPLDLLGMMIPDSLLKNIDAIEIHYERES